MSVNQWQRNQSGAVLLVTLIMLILIGMIVVSGFNLTQINLKSVQNVENRNQVMSAATAAVEEVISSNRFADTPNAVFAVGCGTANAKCYDANGDGTNDVTVSVAAPSCIVVMPIKNSELNVLGKPSDASCYIPEVEYSMCANSVWQIEATATDVVTGAEAVLRQGVSIRTTLNKIDSACPV